jgi:vacuolar-type H+-ATPase subunit H
MDVSGNRLTPLDQIWQTEAEITRQIAAARQEAEQILANARSQIRQIKNQAREAGHREGKAQYRQTIAEAEEEAQALIAQANSRAEDMCRKGQQRMEMAVRTAVSIITGMEGEIKNQ